MSSRTTRIMLAVLTVMLVFSIACIIDGTKKKGEAETKVAEVKESNVVLASDDGIPVPVSVDLDKVIENTEIEYAQGQVRVDGLVIVDCYSVYVRSAADEEASILDIGYEGDEYVWISDFSTSNWVAVKTEDSSTGFIERQYVKVNAYTDKSSAFFDAGFVAGSATLAKNDDTALTTGIITPIPTATPTATPVPTEEPEPEVVEEEEPEPEVVEEEEPEPVITETPAYVGGSVESGSEYSNEQLLTCLVYTEASPDYEEQKAVASVVLNRMSRSGDSMWGVITAPYQFGVYSNGSLQRALNLYSEGGWNSKMDSAHDAALAILNGGSTVPYYGFCANYSGVENDYPGGQVIGATYFH